MFNRTKFLRDMRRAPGFIKGMLHTSDGGGYCMVGWLGHLAGIDDYDMEGMTELTEGQKNMVNEWMTQRYNTDFTSWGFGDFIEQIMSNNDRLDDEGPLDRRNRTVEEVVNALFPATAE